MILVEGENLIVGDSTRIGEVVDAYEEEKSRREGREEAKDYLSYYRSSHQIRRNHPLPPPFPPSLPPICTNMTCTRELALAHDEGDGEEVG